MAAGRTLTLVIIAATAVACSDAQSGGGGRATPAAGSSSTSSTCHAGNGQPNRVVSISNGSGHQQAVIAVAVGNVFAVDVGNSNFDVSEPTVTVHPDVLCRVSVTAPGHDRRAIFLAQQPGDAYISATITGVGGGVNHPAYGVRVTVK